MKILFVFPTVAEIPNRFKPKAMKSDKLYDCGKDCQIACIGIGKRASESVKKICLRYKPDFIMLLGFGGGIDKKLLSGDMVICSHFESDGHKIIKSDKIWLQILEKLKKIDSKVFYGRCFTSEKLVKNKELKLELLKKNISVVDMENYWIAKSAKKLRIPFISIRATLDNFEWELPDMSETITCDGQILIGKTIKHIITKPIHLIDMIKIAFLRNKILSRFDNFITILLNDE